MKNIYLRSSNSFYRNFKLRFKLTSIAVLFLSLPMFGEVFSQELNANLKNTPLREVFKIFKSKTGVYFMYNEEEIAPDIRISADLRKKEIGEALDIVLRDLPYSWEFADGMIIIKPKQKNQQPKKKFLISGKITDEAGVEIAGATVVLKERKHIGCASLTDGSFSLDLSSLAKEITVSEIESMQLVVSFVGMQTQIIKIGKRRSFSIRLKISDSDLDEVVVTGYQTMDKRESASAVSTIKVADIQMNGIPSIDQMLQGKIPGMMVINTSGEPGSTPKIRIRGTSTINGNKAPVWVVDGVILEQDIPITASDLNSEDAQYLVGNAIAGISPQDIESITVLKDASATAIYGVKAANGVIVLTTKKGKTGKPVISYHGELMVNQRPDYRNFNLMNSAERMQFSKEIFEDGLLYGPGISLNPADSYEGLLYELINRRISKEDFGIRVMEMAKRNTDWFKELFRNAVTNAHTLSLSGGSENTKYYFSAGYNKNEGGAVKSLSERFTSLAKIDFKIGKYSDLMAKIEYNTIDNRGYSKVNPFSYAYKTSRTLLPYNEDGSYHMYKYGIGYDYNVFNELENTGKQACSDKFTALLTMKIKLMKGFSYQGTFSFHRSSTSQREWQTAKSHAIAEIRKYNYKEYDENQSEYWDSPLPYGGILHQENIRKKGYTIRNAFEYKKLLDERHDFNLYAGSEIRSLSYTGTGVKGYGWTPEYGERFMPVYTQKFKDNYATTGALLPVNTNTISRVASFFGSASYMYANRYVMNFNIRSDGANKFGSNPKYRWLPTWSVAGKWILTNESFWSERIRNNSFIALRGSYGVQGNIHDDATPNLIFKIKGIDPTSSLQQSDIYRLPNPDLRWEKTSSWNTAVDFSFFSGRLSGSIDIYKKYTEDLIMDKTVAASNGRHRLHINAGEMTNSGIEGNIHIEILKHSLLKWDLNANFGRNTGKITLANSDFYNTDEEIDEMLKGNIAVEREKLGLMYSFRYAGLMHEDGYPLFYGKDGKVYHEGDKRRMALIQSGSIFPDLSGGFDTQLKFKNLVSLSIGFTYSIGNVKRLPRVYKDKARVFNPLANVSTDWKNRWRKPGDENRTDIPVLYNARIAGNFAADGLRNVSKEDLARFDYCTYFYDLSDLRVAKGDYLRLRQIGLSYTMPQKNIRRIGLTSLILRFQATNLYVWADKKWKGLDPETPEANIPLLPSYSLSLDLSF